MMPGRMTGSVMVCFQLAALITYKYEAHHMVSEARYGLSKQQSLVQAVVYFHIKRYHEALFKTSIIICVSIA